MHNALRTLTIAGLVAVALCGRASAQDGGDQASKLAKAAQNPLAAMVTLPLQFNFNSGVGPYDRQFFNLNVQPVVPFTGEKWNVISRTIIPVNLLLGYYDNSERPDGAADSQVRFQVNFLFPHRAK